MIGLTRQQQIAFVFTADYIAANGRAPTLMEITRALGLSAKSNAHRLLCALEERGYVRRLPGRARAIEIVVQSAGFKVKPELHEHLTEYAKEAGMSEERALNELLRGALGLAA